MLSKNLKRTNLASEVIEELKKVTWPSKKHTFRLTMIVIFFALIIGLYVGIIDIFLTKGLELITK